MWKLQKNDRVLRGRSNSNKDTQKLREDTGISKKRKCKRKNNDIRVNLKGHFVKQKKKYLLYIKKKKLI